MSSMLVYVLACLVAHLVLSVVAASALKTSCSGSDVLSALQQNARPAPAPPCPLSSPPGTLPTSFTEAVAGGWVPTLLTEAERNVGQSFRNMHGRLFGSRAATASQTFYNSRAAFNEAAPGLPVETFESGNVPASSGVVCPSPLNSGNNDACFAPGSILPGIEFSSSESRPDDGLALFGAGLNNAPSKQLVANYFDDSFVIDFVPSVNAVGMDLVSLADAVAIDIYGEGGVLLNNVTGSSSPSGTFWGVISATPIARIVVFSPIGHAEGTDNVAFGDVVVDLGKCAGSGTDFPNGKDAFCGSCGKGLGRTCSDICELLDVPYSSDSQCSAKVDAPGACATCKKGSFPGACCTCVPASTTTTAMTK